MARAVDDALDVFRPSLPMPVTVEERATSLERRVTELEMILWGMVGLLVVLFLLLRR